MWALLILVITIVIKSKSNPMKIYKNGAACKCHGRGAGNFFPVLT
jgi:hypothetical protein